MKGKVYIVQTEWDIPCETGHDIYAVCGSYDVACKYLNEHACEDEKAAETGDLPSEFNEYDIERSDGYFRIYSKKCPDYHVSVFIETYDLLRR